MIKVGFDERKGLIKNALLWNSLSFLNFCLDCRPQGHEVALGNIYYSQGVASLPLKQHWPLYQIRLPTNLLNEKKINESRQQHMSWIYLKLSKKYHSVELDWPQKCTLTIGWYTDRCQNIPKPCHVVWWTEFSETKVINLLPEATHSKMLFQCIEP